MIHHDLRQQRTIAQPVRVEGFGYWGGQDVRVEFRPAPADSGIVFVRSDLEPPNRIPARVEHRIETPRRTTLVAGNAAVEMVEHVMAALYGLQIDNCEVWTDGAEMPGFDGSSKAFVDALQSAGVVVQGSPRPVLIVDEICRVSDGEAWIEARPVRPPQLRLKYRLDYRGVSSIGRQTIEIGLTAKTFAKELAPARTFLLKQEADWLRSRGLGQRVTYQDVLVFDNEAGPIENKLRFADECVRHKALDLSGDLALAGCDLIGRIIAHCSGHRLNAELVKALLSEGQVVEGRRRSA